MDIVIASLEAEITRLEDLASEAEARAAKCKDAESADGQIRLATTIRVSAKRVREGVERLRMLEQGAPTPKVNARSEGNQWPDGAKRLLRIS